MTMRGGFMGVKLIIPFILLGAAAAPATLDERKLVDGTEIRDVRFEKGRFRDGAGFIEGNDNNISFVDRIAAGDFTIKSRLWLRDLNESYAHFKIDDNFFCFDSAKQTFHVNGPKFGGPQIRRVAEAAKYIKRSEAFEFEIRRRSGKMQIFIDNQQVYATEYGDSPVGFVGFFCSKNTLRIYNWSISGNFEETPREQKPDAQNQAQFQNRVDTAIDNGIRYLLNYQCRDGSWGYHASMFPGGQTALCAYTLMKCGIPTSHPALQRAFAYLDQLEPIETYTLACLLMAYEAAQNVNYKPRMQQLLNTLVGANERGLWSYPYTWNDPWRAEKGLIDLSNTQFAVLGMRAAHKAGIDVPAALWKQVLESGLKFQETIRIVDASGPARKEGATGTGKIPIGGFSYRAGEGAFGSMTAAGICVIKIGTESLGKTLSAAQLRTLQNSIDAGVNWLAENFTVSANPKHGDWVYYYLYGLERVGAFLKIEKIGEHDWYREGAAWLLGKQGNDGAWSEYDHAEADTCFALLFLKRATAAVITGNDTKAPKDLYISEAPANAVNMRATGNNKLRAWISGFGDAAKKQYGAGAIGGLRVARVDYIIDGKIVQSVPGNPSKPWRDEKFLLEYEFFTTGKHKVSAAAQLVDPAAPAEEKEPTIAIYASGFEVNVESVLNDWMLPAARSRSRNLMLTIGKTTTASSQANGGETPPRASDGLESSRWLFAANDAHPALTIELQSTVKANTIVLSQAYNKPASAGLFDKITQVEIVINNQKPQRFDLDPDDMKPTAIPLGKIFTITRIEVRVVARVKNGAQPGIGGFSEITLENRK